MKTTQASPTIDATTDVINVTPASDEREAPRRRVREFGSLVFSAAFHTSVLLVLAYWVLPATVYGHLALTAWFNPGEEAVPDDLLLQDVAAPELAVELETSPPIPEPNSELPVLEFVDTALIRADVPAAIESRPVRPSTASPGEAAESLRAASSIEEAVDGVTGSIQGKLEEGDLLVVWLLDASYSMADDRRRLATRLGSFLQQLAGGASSPHQLLNAVVSFGAAMEEHVAPTESRDTVVDSVRELPVDASGQENVFAAIGQCVSKYRRRWRDSGLMIVVWTDESGDDVTKLENTIRICRDHGVSVSVVGPSAVLGAEMGSHSFTDPQSQRILHLPVKRGPDSPAPERLELDYWFLTREPQAEFGSRRGFSGAGLPAWYGTDDLSVAGYKCIAAIEVPLPSWYGGRDLKGIVSGFGPYALTRLALQTGGTYTIFDRAEDRGPFRVDAMRPYLPDYRSVKEYLHDVESRPLRHAVMQAVKLAQNKKLGPPPTILFGQRYELPPYGFMRTYFTPARFVAHLRGSRLRLRGLADRTTRIVEQALAHVSEGGSLEYGLEYEYRRENSPRWRAWYDLTRGRLLATSVRLEEYRLTCDLAVEPGFLDETTNHVILVPSLEMKSDSRFRRRAEEAERLLTRCVRENPNTPWAWLAQRELDYALGIDVRQHVLMHVEMPLNSTQHAQLPKM